VYEVGLPEALWGTPAGEALSLGLHESQARLVENVVGRSRSFWLWCLPRMRAAFEPALDDTTLDTWMEAVTHVAPTPLRVRADEVTYTLHILLRYRLERALVNGTLKVGELSAAWAEQSVALLGFRPRNDVEGSLQDGHWAAGMFGYFPAYALGNLAAAQLYAAALRDHPALEDGFAQGDFSTLLGWLAERVHRHGSTLPIGARVEAATGSPLGVDSFLAHLQARYVKRSA